MMGANQLTATELIQVTKNELLKARYTELSMKGVERVWRNLEEYLQSKGIVYFSKDVGMAFLEERYQYSLDPETDPNKRRLRAIQLLLDLQVHERILIRRSSNVDFQIKLG